ncbi:hypothetical protein FRC03_009366 [Tulasnella sp. 419]|nr:hypothetical protein FRC02_010949 [Tulasnella sp. 418]KAG8958202.1 hypothetical protein FRC03_009366 [Tulasnella sp. 419]
MSSEPKASRPSGRRANDLDVQISKTMSYILRHGASKEKLDMRPDGYVKVDELLARPKMSKLGCDFAKLKEIVDTNSKQRFKLIFESTTLDESIPSNETAGVWWIRANQGHTVEVEGLELTEVTDPLQIPIAVHGTKIAAWESIAKNGLSKMKRNHIHLAQGLPGSEGVTSGMRSDSTVLIFIDHGKAMESGLRFYVSTNGVLLTEGDENGYIAPHMFQTVIWRRRGDIKYWNGSDWVDDCVTISGEPSQAVINLATM